MSIDLLIADDHEVIRAGLLSMFQGTEIHLAAEAIDGEQVLPLALELCPDVALLDVRLAGCDGITCLRHLHTQIPDLPVIMFSSNSNPTYIARSVAMGAVGYLSKTASRSEIIMAIRQAANGQSIWTRDELRRVTGSLSIPHTSIDMEIPLTRREGEVLKLLALGLSNKEIAQALTISYETVKEHVQHILKKVGVADRTQAAVWAVRKGLV